MISQLLDIKSKQKIKNIKLHEQIDHDKLKIGRMQENINTISLENKKINLDLLDTTELYEKMQQELITY